MNYPTALISFFCFGLSFSGQAISESLNIRSVQQADFSALHNLYKVVARQPGGIARNEHEITHEYIQKILNTVAARGIMLVAEYNRVLVSAVHCSTPEPQVFSHVLNDLTIVVHPEWQSKGVGRKIFSALLEKVRHEYPSILRIELFVRESNTKAIAFYQSLGFVTEGRLEKRIMAIHGLEADISMAWFNPDFKTAEILKTSDLKSS